MNNAKSRFWEFFQGLGKTFMLPVALLAFMGLMLGIGSSFTSPSTIEALPFLDNRFLQTIFRFMSTIGGFAFTYLPVLFAIAIPLGLARYEKGVAAFSGFVGFVIMHLSINFYLTETSQLAAAEKLREAGQGMVMGIQTIEMGVLGGIIVGVIVHLLHSRFYNIQLPDAFAFFGGARFVPIITSLTLAVVGILIPIIWPIRHCYHWNWPANSKIWSIWSVHIRSRRTFIAPIRTASYSCRHDSIYRSRGHPSC